jgi:hypothetical protein
VNIFQGKSTGSVFSGGLRQYFSFNYFLGSYEGWSDAALATAATQERSDDRSDAAEGEEVRRVRRVKK